MRRAFVLLVVILASVLPARASHSEGCGGGAPHKYRCELEFIAAADIARFQIDGDIIGVVSARAVNRDNGESISLTCSGTACLSPDGRGGGKFKAGHAVYLEAFAIGVGPWIVRAVYVN